MAHPALSIFLNIPYDYEFSDLYLAYIAGTTCFGLVPRATLEIPGGQRRLDRILALIRTCPYSLHDLSRVELDRRRPATPRFNMPFELGLTVAWERISRAKHTWFVFESKPQRAEKSLSDLKGSDIYIHNGKPRGVFRELCNAFVRLRSQPTVGGMERVLDGLVKHLPDLRSQSGASSPFEARVFKELVLAARALARVDGSEWQ